MTDPPDTDETTELPVAGISPAGVRMVPVWVPRKCDSCRPFGPSAISRCTSTRLSGNASVQMS